MISHYAEQVIFMCHIVLLFNFVVRACGVNFNIL